MRIVMDTREKPRAVVRILDTFEKEGIEVVRRALPFGDYIDPDRPGIVIDRKKNLSEVAQNVSTKDKARFIRELERCNKAGWKMVVLIEHSSQFKRLEDVIGWKNPTLQYTTLAVDGDRLFRIMHAMANHYGFTWAFCNKMQTGKRIIQILGGELKNE